MDSRDTDQRIRLIAHSSPQALTLAVSGEVDLESAEPLRLALAAAARFHGRVCVDLSAVAFADTTLVNALLQARLSLGERLRVAAPSRPVRRLLVLLGVDGVLALDPPGAARRAQPPHRSRVPEPRAPEDDGAEAAPPAADPWEPAGTHNCGPRRN
ncbi:STAS domain-containing protein [Streptomyces sp. NPDC006552]|uniref:STAS domain-containing protein n=1 Tax=Streptomyces sp. NPDC006552 TaxID=3157179 RepID=UPI0033A35324